MSTSDRKDSDILLTPPSGGRTGEPRKRRNLFATGIVVVGGIIVLLTVVSLMARAKEGTAIEAVPTVEAKRGPLTVSVTVGGTLQAMESQDIKSEVEGNNQILEIVPEGTVITPQDVKDGKVLVRLDSSGLEDKQASRAVDLQNAQANYVQAEENLVIQRKQNESNLASAELTLKFARMTLAQYMGDDLAQKLLATVQEGPAAATGTPAAEDTGSTPPAPTASATKGGYDFTQLPALASYQVEGILEQNASATVAAAQAPVPTAEVPATGSAQMTAQPIGLASESASTPVSGSAMPASAAEAASTDVRAAGRREHPTEGVRDPRATSTSR